MELCRVRLSRRAGSDKATRCLHTCLFYVRRYFRVCVARLKRQALSPESKWLGTVLLSITSFLRTTLCSSRDQIKRAAPLSLPYWQNTSELRGSELVPVNQPLPSLLRPLNLPKIELNFLWPLIKREVLGNILDSPSTSVDGNGIFSTSSSTAYAKGC